MIENLKFGLLLMVVGMGMVFLILAMLWGMITIFQRMDRRLFAKEAEEAEPAATPMQEPEPELLAAMAVAIHRYRLEASQAVPQSPKVPHRLEPSQARWVAVGRAYQLRSNLSPRKSSR